MKKMTTLLVVVTLIVCFSLEVLYETDFLSHPEQTRAPEQSPTLKVKNPSETPVDVPGPFPRYGVMGGPPGIPG